MSIHLDYPPVGPVSAALHGRSAMRQRQALRRLPRYPTVVRRLRSRLRFFDPGDGPSVFVSLIGGAIVVGSALWAEVNYEPPMWVDMVIFLPLTLVVCLGILRPLKALLIGLQYRHKAEQGRLSP